MRARDVAGVRAGGEGGSVHRARGDLQHQAGALVPRAGAQQGGGDDQHLHLRDPLLVRLLHPDEAGLQADHVAGVQGEACHGVQDQEGPRAHPGVAAQEEMSPAR